MTNRELDVGCNVAVEVTRSAVSVMVSNPEMKRAMRPVVHDWPQQRLRQEAELLLRLFEDPGMNLVGHFGQKRQIVSSVAG